MSYEIIQGHVLNVIPAMPAELADCVVTSPPYWGLRDYKLPPQVWGGDPGCTHDFSVTVAPMPRGGETSKSTLATAGGKLTKSKEGVARSVERQIARPPGSSFCALCGAWLGSLGLEPTPELYLEHCVEVFREVRRVLRKDGTLWINIGDSYAGSRAGHEGFGTSTIHGTRHNQDEANQASRRRRGKDCDPKRGKSAEGQPYRHAGHAPTRFSGSATLDGRLHTSGGPPPQGLKPKDMVCIPWRLGLALQADGWWLRQDVIWSKKNCMPESVRDRCTKSHEYLLLLSKSERYYFNINAIKERASEDTHARYARGRSKDHKWADGGPGNQSIARSFDGMLRKPGVNPKAVAGWAKGPGDHSAIGHAQEKDGRHGKLLGRVKQNESFSAAVKDVVEFRNKRSVWEIATEPYSEAHFATFPQDLVRPCILAGCRPGGTVLDPFTGSGTTLLVAESLDCKGVGIELSQEYIEMAKRRLGQAVIEWSQGEHHEQNAQTHPAR